MTTASNIAAAPSSDNRPRHPDYSARIEEWEQMLHTYEGQSRVKKEGTKYLPPTAGMLRQGFDRAGANANSDVARAYEDYRLRAEFPEFVSDSVASLLGIMHRGDVTIELPAPMSSMADVLTVLGESAEGLLRRVNEAQLVCGRMGLLLDPVDGAPATTLPRVATYVAASILNWHTEVDRDTGIERLKFLVLDESRYVMQDDFSWEWQVRTRYLRMAAAQGPSGEVVGAAVYQSALVEGERKVTDSDWRTITVGMQPLNRIPFVVVNVVDVGVMCPAKPPLLGLSNLALKFYRKSADYEQHLHESGQDTLVAVGRPDPDKPIKVGAGAVIDVQIGGGAEYIGVSGKGLPEQRISLENEQKRADGMQAHLVDTRGSGVEAAEALRIRVAARTASLTNIATAGAAGVADVLRIAAEWMGQSPAAVTFEPNYDFADDPASPDDLSKMMDAVLKGLPLLKEEVRDWLVKREFATKPWDEVKEQWEEEQMMSGAASRDLDPAGGEDPPDPDPKDNPPEPGDE